MSPNRLATFAALIALVLTSCGADPSPLVGRWEPTEPADSGFAGVFEFHADGTATSGLVVQVSYPYTIEGTTLVLQGPEGDPAGGRRATLAVDGTDMVLDGVSAKQRVGPPTAGAHPVVGVWTSTHETGSTAYERFGADGRVDLRIPMPGVSLVPYKVSGSTLTLTLAGGVSKLTFAREGEFLTLTSKGDRPRRFRRVPAWYPLEVAATEPAAQASEQDATTTAALSLTPRALAFGLVRPGEAAVRSLRLESRDPNVHVSDVTVSLSGEGGEPLQWAEHFSAEVKPSPGTNVAEVELRLQGLPEGAKGSFQGVLVIRTGQPAGQQKGQPKGPEELVRFSGVCRE